MADKWQCSGCEHWNYEWSGTCICDREKSAEPLGIVETMSKTIDDLRQRMERVERELGIKRR